MEGCAGEGPGRAGWGEGITLVCAFGVEDRVLVGGEVLYGTRCRGAGCANSRVVSEYRCAVKGGW